LKIWEKTILKKYVVSTVVDDVPLSELKEILQNAIIGIEDKDIEMWIEQKDEKLENCALLSDQEIIESVKNKDIKTVDDNNDNADENLTMNAPTMP
jgi:hypothetical protein